MRFHPPDSLLDIGGRHWGVGIANCGHRIPTHWELQASVGFYILTVKGQSTCVACSGEGEGEPGALRGHPWEVDGEVQ